MRLALFSDIHANLPALEAFLLHMEEQGQDAIYCLGNLVGYNIWPNEVVEIIRRRLIPTIAGNYDFGIARKNIDCGCIYRNEKEEHAGQISVSFTNAIMQKETRAYLYALPTRINLEFPVAAEKVNVLLVHGSPRRLNETVGEDYDERKLLRMMRQAKADVLCVGNTYKPYHRILADDENGNLRYRHVVSVGSVGKPQDGDPRGCYALLHIDEEGSLANKDCVGVGFRRFAYDIDRAARAIEDIHLPREFADMLRRAY